MPHAGWHFFNAEPGSFQQQNHFRLRVIFRIPVRKSANDIATGGAKPTRAIGDAHARQQANQPTQHGTARHAQTVLVISPFTQESATDDEVSVGFLHVPYQVQHFRGSMLPVAITLDGDVIPVQRCVAIAGLHRATNAQVEGHGNHGRHIARHMGCGVVGRAIVDDENVIVGQRAVQPMD